MGARRATRNVRSRRTETADEALRRLLAEQFAVIAKNEPRAATGSVAALHDIRVALRRMRSLALTFWKLAPDFLESLDKRASKVCDRMGNARDLDVWIELFRGLAQADGGRKIAVRDGRAVLAALKRARTRAAAEALSCGIFRRTKKMLREFLRRRPTVRGKKTPARERFAARRMLAVRWLVEERYRRVGNFSKNAAHDLRRAGRRMRYLAEFFAPWLGRDCVRAGKWIAKAQAALGKVHDCDSALEFTKELPTGTARSAVRRALKKRRAAQLRKFKAAWRRYADRRLQKAFRARLEAAAGRA